jgi:hypothetical protein
MNVLTSDVSLEDGIGKESGNMHVDGNDCKLHPTMMIGATKVPPGNFSFSSPVFIEIELNYCRGPSWSIRSRSVWSRD